MGWGCEAERRQRGHSFQTFLFEHTRPKRFVYYHESRARATPGRLSRYHKFNLMGTFPLRTGAAKQRRRLLPLATGSRAISMGVARILVSLLGMQGRSQ